MWILGFAIAWAENVQEFVYTISQNGMEIGQRNVAITYMPKSNSIPHAYKKVEISSDCTLNIAGKAIRYQQKGVGQFSPTRSNFVISNQIEDTVVEFQGKRDKSGNWTVFTINKGSSKKTIYSPLEVNITSIEMFLPRVWLEEDRLDLLLVDTDQLILQNSVWKEAKKRVNGIPLQDHIEQSNTTSTKDVLMNDVRDKDGILLFTNIQALGTELSLSLQSLPNEMFFGEIKEDNNFSGIEEQEL